MKKAIILVTFMFSLVLGDCTYDKSQMHFFYNLYVTTQNPYEKQKYYNIYLSYLQKVQQNCR